MIDILPPNIEVTEFGDELFNFTRILNTIDINTTCVRSLAVLGYMLIVPEGLLKFSSDHIVVDLGCGANLKLLVSEGLRNITMNLITRDDIIYSSTIAMSANPGRASLEICIHCVEMKLCQEVPKQSSICCFKLRLAFANAISFRLPNGAVGV